MRCSDSKIILLINANAKEPMQITFKTRSETLLELLREFFEELVTSIGSDDVVDINSNDNLSPARAMW